eukprot:5856359-Alexandrium_andersonii.AAC.1
MHGLRRNPKIGPRTFVGGRSAPLYALSPMATTRSAPGGRKSPRNTCFGRQFREELDSISPVAEDLL